MKIKVDTDTFVQAIQWVTRRYDAKDAKASIHLKIDAEGKGRLSYENNAVFMAHPFKVTKTPEEAIALALDGTYLSKLAGVLKANEAVLDFDLDKPRSQLKVQCGQGKFVVPRFEFKARRDPEYSVLGEGSTSDFFALIRSLTRVGDMENAGHVPALGAIDLELDTTNSKLTMMATDRYVMAVVTDSFEPSEEMKENFEEGLRLLLPVEEASVISPSKESSSSFDFLYSDATKKFGYSFGSGIVALFALRDIEPLRYQQLKKNADANNTNSVVLEMGQFKTDLKNISDLSWMDDITKIVIKDGVITLTDENDQNEIVVNPVEQSLVEEDQTIVLTRSILNKVFGPISAKRAKVRWASVSKPIVFEPLLDDGSVNRNVFAFVMPKVK